MLLRESEEASAKADRIATEQARAEGKLVDYSEIKEQIVALVKKFPETPVAYRTRGTMQPGGNGVNVAPPPLPFTPEQIADRRDAERAEIHKVLQESD